MSGQSVNIMTLGGLALVIGTLLDNNIVVQENLIATSKWAKMDTPRPRRAPSS